MNDNFILSCVFLITFLISQSCTTELDHNLTDTSVADSIHLQEIKENSTQIIVKEGILKLKTKDSHADHISIQPIIDSLQIKILSDKFQNLDLNIQRSLLLQIPLQSFDPFIEVLSKNPKNILLKQIYLKEKQDKELNNLIQNQKELENKISKLLDSTQSETTIKALENQLTNIRLGIYQMESEYDKKEQIKPYALLHLVYYEDVSIFSKYGNRIQNSLTKGSLHLMSFIALFINFWPFLLLIIVYIFYLRRRRKKLKKNKVNSTD